METTGKKQTAPYEMSIYSMKFEKLYTIMVSDPDINQCNIDDLLEKIAIDYTKTLGGKAFLRETNGVFTIKDLFERVPDEIFSKHGVIPLKDEMSKFAYNLRENLISPVPKE